MKEPIYISKENYSDYLNLDVVAFSFASGGAQGTPGEIIVVNKDGVFYSMNYCFDNMPIWMCYEVCPPLVSWFSRDFDKEKEPTGWRGIDLGAGNYLVLAELLYNDLKQDLLEMQPCYRYQKWKNMVKSWISNTEHTTNN